MISFTPNELNIDAILEFEKRIKNEVILSCDEFKSMDSIIILMAMALSFFDMFDNYEKLHKKKYDPYDFIEIMHKCHRERKK